MPPNPAGLAVWGPFQSAHGHVHPAHVHVLASQAPDMDLRTHGTVSVLRGVTSHHGMMRDAGQLASISTVWREHASGGKRSM